MTIFHVNSLEGKEIYFDYFSYFCVIQTRREEYHEEKKVIVTMIKPA
jgi:hypothetical protein